MSWTIDDCHDAYMRASDNPDPDTGRRRRIFLHRFCHEIEQERTWMELHAKSAREAGLGSMVVVPTKNEYYVGRSVASSVVPGAYAEGRDQDGSAKTSRPHRVERRRRRFAKSEGRGTTVEQVATFAKSISANALFPVGRM